GQVPPLPHRQPPEIHVHNTNTLKAGDLKSEMLCHAANLAVQPLHQGDAKYKTAFLHDFALLGHGAKYGHTARHALNKSPGDRFVDSYHVFFFVVVAGSQDFVDQVTVTCHEDQAL